MRQTIIFLVLAYFSSAFAFTTSPVFVARPSTSLFAESDKDGGAAIAKPKVGVETKQVTKQKAKSVEKKRASHLDQFLVVMRISKMLLFSK